MFRAIEKIVAPETFQQRIQRHHLLVDDGALITREIVVERVRLRVEQRVRRADHDLDGRTFEKIDFVIFGEQIEIFQDASEQNQTLNGHDQEVRRGTWWLLAGGRGRRRRFQILIQLTGKL